MTNNSLSVLFFLFLSIISGCNTAQVSDTGSGTGTGNPIVIGIATDSRGDTLNNATVDVYFSNSDLYIVDSISQNDFRITTINTSGFFTIQLPSEGNYRIEITSEDSSEAISIPAQFFNEDTTLDLQNISTSPLDTLRGIINLFGDDITNDSILVEVIGSGRNVLVIQGEPFLLPLPQGVFDLFITPFCSNHPQKVFNNVSSNADNFEFNILAFNPISNDYTTDSLIVRAILDHNNLDTVSVGTVSNRMFSNWRWRITELDIFRQNIYEVPSTIGRLSALTDLELQHTFITSLPPEVSELNNLRELELNDNKLKSLPIEITQLDNLVQLRLENNQITYLPEKISEWATSLQPDWAETQTLEIK